METTLKLKQGDVTVIVVRNKVPKAWKTLTNREVDFESAPLVS
jgi:hypothetical protein